jgi:hypothetical protein
MEENPTTTFGLFLDEFDRYRQGKHYAIAIDEFEIIERYITEGILKSNILEYLRGLFQYHSWLLFAFAGLHTLEEMNRDYWQPFFQGLRTIKVSFLDRQAATKLITQPTPDFPLNYEAAAIKHIIELTAGQPYLIQLICDGLVQHFNDCNADEDNEPHSGCFNQAEVEKIITQKSFEINGSGYFDGIWAQADDTAQKLILQYLAIEALSFDSLVVATNLDTETVQKAIEILERHDAIQQRDELYTYQVPIMQRWVAQHKPLDRPLEVEEDKKV